MPFAIATTDPALRLRPENPADADFVRRLFETVRAEQFVDAGLPGPVLEQLLEQQFRLQAASHARRFPASLALIVERQQVPIGRLLIDCEDQRWHVIDIVLVAECRGQGVGATVMRGVEAAARARGAHLLTLMVLETNIRACRLYARLGFAETSSPAGDGYLTFARRLNS